jgi:hypothetical protein
VIFCCLRWMWEFCRESHQIGLGLAVSARISHLPEWSLGCDKCCVCWGRFWDLGEVQSEISEMLDSSLIISFLLKILWVFHRLYHTLIPCECSGISSIEYPWHCRWFTFPYQFESLMCSRDTSTHRPLYSKWDGRHESSSISSFLGIMKRYCVQIQH